MHHAPRRGDRSHTLPIMPRPLNPVPSRLIILPDRQAHTHGLSNTPANEDARFPTHPSSMHAASHAASVVTPIFHRDCAKRSFHLRHVIAAVLPPVNDKSFCAACQYCAARPSKANMGPGSEQLSLYRTASSACRVSRLAGQDDARIERRELETACTSQTRHIITGFRQ